MQLALVSRNREMESSVRDRINRIFDLLELLVVRLTLLILLIVGAYTLIRGHP